MTHREYWQRIGEIKFLTKELGRAWNRFDSEMRNIRSHLARSRVILREAEQQQTISEELIEKLKDAQRPGDGT